MIIFDNINYKVYDDLKKEIKKGTKIAISAAYFSILFSIYITSKKV